MVRDEGDDVGEQEEQQQQSNLPALFFQDGGAPSEGLHDLLEAESHDDSRKQEAEDDPSEGNVGMFLTDWQVLVAG